MNIRHERKRSLCCKLLLKQLYVQNSRIRNELKNCNYQQHLASVECDSFDLIADLRISGEIADHPFVALNVVTVNGTRQYTAHTHTN